MNKRPGPHWANLHCQLPEASRKGGCGHCTGVCEPIRAVQWLTNATKRKKLSGGISNKNPCSDQLSQVEKLKALHARNTLEVEMSKKWTKLWPEAHFEVKMLRLNHFWALRCRFAWQAQGIVHLAFNSFNYNTTLHYATFRYATQITLITLHYTTRTTTTTINTLHYTTLKLVRCAQLHYATQH